MNDKRRVELFFNDLVNDTYPCLICTVFESRYPRNKTRKIIMAVVIPSFLFFILLAKYRDARFVF